MLTNIFQMGWNHQLDMNCYCPSTFPSLGPCETSSWFSFGEIIQFDDCARQKMHQADEYGHAHPGGQYD